MHRFHMLPGLVCSLFIITSARADQWAFPTREEFFSEGSNFVAVIQPATKADGAKATMHKLTGGERTKVWEANLSNEASPVSASVSPDGRHLVTFDNWHRVGYGDDIVAIYDANGQLAKYSLEEFAPPPVAITNELSVVMGTNYLPRMAYFRLFSHSISSRWWKKDSIHFFFPGREPEFFCLWLDWDQRWVGWSLSNGSLIQVSEKQASHWTAEGRRRSLQQIESNPDDADAMNFLGRRHVGADRPLIEAWLKDTQFFSSYSHSSTKDDELTRFVFKSYSTKRQKADEMLSRWDGLASPDRSYHYNFLGSVQGVLRLPAPPGRSDGYLRIQLLPEGASSSTGLAAPVEHQLIADLAVHSPRGFREGRMHHLSLSTNVEFAIYGVTPGSYRVKAVWDKHTPFCGSTNSACAPGKGDVISTNLPLVIVRKGNAAPSVTVDCKTLVE